MFTHMHRRIALILFALFALPSLSASAAITTAPVITTAWGASNIDNRVASAAMNAISSKDYPVRVSIPSLSIDSEVHIADSSNGRTTASGAVNWGSSP
jgi:hypothetical protein